MITSAIITRQADRDGVPAPTVERDYVLTHVLAGIAAQAGAECMVFKAQGRWLDFKARMDAKPRRPPRPAGKDAP